MLYGAFFLTVTLLLYGLIRMNEERRTRVKRRLQTFVERENEPDPEPAAKNTAKPKAIARMAKMLRHGAVRLFRRRIREEKLARIELKLLQAGRPWRLSALDYRLLQVLLIVILPLLFGAYGFLIHLAAGTMFLLAVLGLAIAFLLPPYYLKIKIAGRTRQALRELPDVLDLLTVSLEAGLGFDAALSKLVSKQQGVLAGEFQRCLEEIRLGRTRREALTGVRDRVPLEEIRGLIGSILQAEKLGIGMVQVLRVQSQEVREQRRQRAEEAAMKAPIKMLFPLVLFIFPSLFIVLLGPVLIQFLQTFHKG